MKTCARCDELIDEKKDYIRSYLRGVWIYLHEECAQFLNDAKQGKRPKGKHV